MLNFQVMHFSILLTFDLKNLYTCNCVICFSTEPCCIFKTWFDSSTTWVSFSSARTYAFIVLKFVIFESLDW